MTNRSVVNPDGQLVELWVIANDDGLLLGYELPADCTAVEYLNDVLTTTNGVQHTPVKPRWDFETSAWTDDATAEELAAAYPAVVPEPSVEERIAALEDMMLEQLLGGV